MSTANQKFIYRVGAGDRGVRSVARFKAASSTTPVQERGLAKCHCVEAISSSFETWCETSLVVSIELIGGISGEASTAKVPAIDHDFEPVLGVDRQAEEAEKSDYLFDG
jgi:hypothetical protein